MISYFFIARTYTVQKGNAAWFFAVGCLYFSYFQHLFKLHRSDNTLVNSIPQLLLVPGIESFESAGKQHRRGDKIQSIYGLHTPKVVLP